MRRARSTALLVVAMLVWSVLALAGAGGSSPASAAPVTTPSNPGGTIPLFAFYYQWFDPSSWNRAKIDIPQLGKYSSDDPRVMRQHIAWAKSVGIDGFVVSWKETTTNDRRLKLLMTVAKQENFKLAMIYQGLDFQRKPLPMDRVRSDFEVFRNEFASDPVFYRLGGKPLTIFSGTWAYSHADVAAVTSAVRPGILVLSTEKSIAGYQRIADVTDGDAYYWSSVNPETNKNYLPKLSGMSQAIHRDGKYWIAPFAPGFDARLIGGTKTVERSAGQTLRTEYAAAVASSPDMLGLISWNEFSENSYVEPSHLYGDTFLNVLRQLRQAATPQPPSAQDSSGPAVAGPNYTHHVDYLPNLVLLVSFVVLLVFGVGLIGRGRRRRAAGPAPRPGGGGLDEDSQALHDDLVDERRS